MTMTADFSHISVRSLLFLLVFALLLLTANGAIALPLPLERPDEEVYVGTGFWGGDFVDINAGPGHQSFLSNLDPRPYGTGLFIGYRPNDKWRFQLGYSRAEDCEYGGPGAPRADGSPGGPVLANVLIAPADYGSERLDMYASLFGFRVIRELSPLAARVRPGFWIGTGVMDLDMTYSLEAFGSTQDKPWARVSMKDSAAYLETGVQFSAPLSMAGKDFRDWELNLALSWLWAGFDLSVGQDDLQGGLFDRLGKAGTVTGINDQQNSLSVDGWNLWFNIQRRL